MIIGIYSTTRKRDFDPGGTCYPYPLIVAPGTIGHLVNKVKIVPFIKISSVRRD